MVSVQFAVYGGGGRAEVLDLTHNSEGGGVQFDDPGWREHANSLKPLVIDKHNATLLFFFFCTF